MQVLDFEGQRSMRQLLGGDCWYYTGSQVYQYKLGKDDLYTVTGRFVRDKPMTQVGIA